MGGALAFVVNPVAAVSGLLWGEAVEAGADYLDDKTGAKDAREAAQKAAEEAKRLQEEQLRLAAEQLQFQQQQYEDARTAQEKQRADQEAKQKSLDAQGATDSANTSRDLALTRQRKLAKQGQSYRDTILTGPLGIPNTVENAPNSKKKTLLGQ